MDFPIISPALGGMVSIEETDGRLRIVDPRPSNDLGITLIVLVVAFVLIFSDFITDSMWSTIIGGIVLLFFLYRFATRPFREVYVIDKQANTYQLHRQSFFKTRTDVGDTRQISAIQVEHIQTDDSNLPATKHDHYRVVFLTSMELLIGMPPS